MIAKISSQAILPDKMHKVIEEGKARVKVFEGKISAKLPVFYNPVMKLNRDITVYLLNSVEKKHMKILLPLAGTGVRGIRLLKELDKGRIKELVMNDLNPRCLKVIRHNLKLNDVKAEVHNEEANRFMLNSKGADYIDIDPFGSPNNFLDAAIKSISREGILAVTATDTAALCGTARKACLRKYWAEPLRNELMHEIGLRILIRKVQMIGAQYDKALIPIFSYAKEHYMRVFFAVNKGKEKVNSLLKKHLMFGNAGPLWSGPLWDKRLAAKMAKRDEKILKIIGDEAKIDSIGFFHMHKMVRGRKVARLPKKDELMKEIRKAGFRAAETHFSPEAIKTDMPEEDFKRRLLKHTDK